MKDLNAEIEKAHKQCEKISDSENISNVEKMRPWIHLNNLLWLKINKMLEDEK